MPHPHTTVIVRQPGAPGVMVVLDTAIDYDPGDPLVKAYPEAFTPRAVTSGVVESVPVEQATAAPGEKRSTRRRV